MKKLKLGVGILLVFILGALTGSLGTKIYFKHRIGQLVKTGAPPIMTHFLMRKLSHELDLTETQQREIEKIVDQSALELQDFRRKCQPELEKIIDRSFGLIKEKLDDEQKKRLEELHEKLINLRAHRHRGPPPFFLPRPNEKTPEQIFATLKKRLHLTEEQEDEVRSIIEKQGEKHSQIIQKYQDQGREGRYLLRRDLQALQEATDKKLETVLTEKQIEKYRKIQEEWRQERRLKLRRQVSRHFNQG